MFCLLFYSASYWRCPCPGCTWKALPCSSDSIQNHLMVFLSQSPLQGHLTLCRAKHWFSRAYPLCAACNGPKAEFPCGELLQSTHLCARNAWNQGHLPLAETLCLNRVSPSCHPLHRGPFSRAALIFLCLNYLRSSNRSGKENTLN